MFWIILLIIIVIRISNLDKETIVIDEQGNKRIINKKEKYTAGKVIKDILLAIAICLLMPIVIILLIFALITIFVIISIVVMSLIAAIIIIPIAIVIFITFVAALASI